MEFPFPLIAGECPVCGRACGAIYRGYYRRWVVCPTLLFIGWVAVRTAFCKHHKHRFALFPNWLIPFRSFSREAFLKLWIKWREKPSELIDSVDRWFDDFEREVYISGATLHSQLRFILRQLRAASHLFAPQISNGGLNALLHLTSVPIERVILNPAFGLACSLRIDPPP